MNLDEYADRFSIADVSRNDDGVLVVRLHSKGESLWWGARPHRQLPELFRAIASDRDNRVVVLTGTGRSFVEIPDTEGIHDLPRGRRSATDWETTISEGNRLIHALLDVEVPMIAAVNGPVNVHSELAVLCDIVLCDESAWFQDAAHFPMGLVPGDCMQIVWPMLLGPNRGRYFLLTGEKLDAREAKELGVVGEVLKGDALMSRALEIAEELATQNPVLLRHTRSVLVRPWKRAMSEDLHLGLSLEALASISGAQFYG